jgi:hypothetical protein
VLIFDGVVREEGVVVERFDANEELEVLRFYIGGEKITEVFESGEVGGR